jgi:hypothetical protein
MHVINLSLGTANPDHRERMLRLAAQARGAAVLIAASSPPENSAMLPAALESVFGVAASDDCAWAEYRYVAAGPINFRAHPSPRPLPGLDQSRNYRGHSFASAHLSALLALLIQDQPEMGFKAARERLLRCTAVELPLKQP